MRKRILTVLIGITLVLTMLFGLLPACGGGPAKTEPGGGDGVAPVAQGEIRQWRYQSTGNAGTATWWIEQEFAKNIGIASGGRLTLDIQPQGAIVGVMEIFDAVATGAIETGSS